MSTLRAEHQNSTDTKDPSPEKSLQALKMFVDSDPVRNQRIADALLDLMNRDVLYPLSDKACITTITEEIPEVGELFSHIQALNAITDYGDVPRPEDFEIVQQQYTGADGKERRPKPKYVPKHMLWAFQSMQKAFTRYLENHPEHVGPHGRPGLIILSGYRSHYYQLGVMARSMLTSGVDYTLASMMLPGQESDHANYQECAIDITNIGDINGSSIHPDGRTVDLLETVEGQWLIKSAPNFGFYHPYPPDINDPLGNLGPNGIVPEPWHIKYAFDSEVAADRSDAIDSQKAFLEKIRRMGSRILS